MSKVQEFLPSGDFNPVAKTTSDPTYTSVSGDLVLADSSGGTVTVNLPASPQAGDRVVFQDSKNNWSTNNLTIGRNSSNIDGSASDYTGDGTVNIIEMIYSGDATVGWLVRTGAAAAPFSPDYGDYGSIVGGTYSGKKSTIDRFAFPFDSGTASAVGTISNSLTMSGGFNSTNYGYSCGGYTTSSLSYIDRIAFTFASGTASYVGNLAASYNYGTGFNSSLHGYAVGGVPQAAATTTINRITFPFDSGTGSNVGGVGPPRGYNDGCNSSSHGYVFAGSYYPVELVSTIARLIFPHDSGSTVNVGNLGYSIYYTTGCNSSTVGFSMGGQKQSVITSAIEGITFPFDSGTASIIGSLSYTKEIAAGINSSTHGYHAGGYKGNYGGAVATQEIDRFTFPLSGSSTVVGNLSASRASLTGVDETDFNTMFR